MTMRTRGLGWTVGGFTIIDDITMDIRRGEFLSIIGPNGAGKSTFVNLLSGTVRPTTGTIEMGGVDVTRVRPSTRVRRGLGRSFQTSSLFPGLTVFNNALLAAMKGTGSLRIWSSPRRNREHVERALECLELVGLADRRDDPARDLPYGDKRRLEIALILCGQPEILLLDEPTAGVSAEQVDAIVDVIRNVHSMGNTVVMVEHHMEAVMSASDRIAVIHQGKLLTIDDPSSVMGNPFVREAYLGGEVMA